jgi:hypothetical protein
MSTGVSTNAHTHEFSTMIHNAKQMIDRSKHSADNTDATTIIVLRAIHKILYDKDILAAGEVMFVQHMPVRLGMRYMYSMLKKMITIDERLHDTS